MVIFIYEQVFNCSIKWRKADKMPASADIDRCDCNVIHEDVVNAVREKLPKEELLLDLADLFKVFGDSTRVRIISALLHSEMCVCDIAALLGMTKSAISHQLRELRQSKLVKYRKEGKVVYYSLDDQHVETLFNQGLSHVSER
jgi:ArsR family transcriptional regulator